MKRLLTIATLIFAVSSVSTAWAGSCLSPETRKGAAPRLRALFHAYPSLPGGAVALAGGVYSALDNCGFTGAYEISLLPDGAAVMTIKGEQAITLEIGQVPGFRSFEGDRILEIRFSPEVKARATTKSRLKFESSRDSMSGFPVPVLRKVRTTTLSLEDRGQTITLVGSDE
jgi:hypothetical protein